MTDITERKKRSKMTSTEARVMKNSCSRMALTLSDMPRLAL